MLLALVSRKKTGSAGREDTVLFVLTLINMIRVGGVFLC